jgi:hypothetical protein
MLLSLVYGLADLNLESCNANAENSNMVAIKIVLPIRNVLKGAAMRTD